MENVIKVRFEKELNADVESLVKETIAKNVGVSQNELFENVGELGENRVGFIYDDELGGEIDIVFGEDEGGAFIEVTSDYVFDIITMNEIIEPLINRTEM